MPPADSPPSACQRTAQHPSAPCTPSARQLTVQCPSTSPQTTRQRTAQHLLSLCKPPAVVLRNRWWLPASHLSMHHAPPSVAPRRSICRLSTHHPLASGAASADASRCPHPPAHKPPARTDTLNPRKNTLCTIVNCPLQIKPVFYFLFTSTAPPAHRIRVKSSLLRLRRSCLALPFTHLGKDIT